MESWSRPEPFTHSGGGRRLRWAQLWPSTRLGRALVGFPVLSAVFTVAAVLWATGILHAGYWTEGEPLGIAGLLVGQLVMTAYVLSAPLALAAVIALTSRRFVKGQPVIAVGGLVFTVVTFWLLINMMTSESSTAALGFLSLPIILGLLVLACGLLAALVHTIRARFAHT